jgi:hypothetical protein
MQRGFSPCRRLASTFQGIAIGKTGPKTNSLANHALPVCDPCLGSALRVGAIRRSCFDHQKIDQQENHNHEETHEDFPRAKLPLIYSEVNFALRFGETHCIDVAHSIPQLQITKLEIQENRRARAAKNRSHTRPGNSGSFDS